MQGDKDTIVRDLVHSAEAESLRLIAHRLGRDNFELSIEVERVRGVAETWRKRWAWSFGANLLAVALAIWTPIIRWLLN